MPETGYRCWITRGPIGVKNWQSTLDESKAPDGRMRATRELVRGRPVVLIEDGRIDRHRLDREDPKEIKTAVLEETGQISAIPIEPR